MISSHARPYIQASVPVLREHGLSITQTFYRSLFDAHPELKNIFNMGNQASGVQQQSLASAVFAYAAHIDNPAALAPVISRIVHKHASLGIGAHHYPIVGRHLLGAIQQTLGEAATPDLLSAWEEAYGALAHALIDEEGKLYAASGRAAGALSEMRVSAIKDESCEVRSYCLVPADGGPLPDFRPGQYVSVQIELPGGQRQLRQYSLSDAPGAPHLRISVKREKADVATPDVATPDVATPDVATPDVTTPDGMVSNYLHDHLTLGSVLRVSAPFGDFTPDTESDRPLVLLSAGVGVTPMISALNHIRVRAPRRPVVFGYAARSPQHHAHRDDLKQAVAEMPNLNVAVFYEAGEATSDDRRVAMHAGRMDVERLPQWALAESDVYLCGPLPFMQAQWRALVARGVAPTRLHREVFGPDLLDHLL